MVRGCWAGKGVACRQIAYSEGILDLGGGSLEWSLYRGLSGWIMYVDYQIISRFLQLFSSLSIYFILENCS